VNDKNANGFTALFFACGLGRIEVVRILIKAGADIHAMTNDGTTALMRASKFGYPDIVALLLSKGVNIYAMTKKSVVTKAGNSALILACENGHTTPVEILLKAGAAKNDSDLGAALLAASRKGHTTCSELIIDWCKHNDTMANVRAELLFSKVFTIYRDGYNHNGFDNYGQDRDGYDRHGFDHRNFDRNGYDRYGFNRDGNKR
jgi:ankyrin repeat protein